MDQNDTFNPCHVKVLLAHTGSSQTSILKATLTFEKFSSYVLAKRDLITPKGERCSKSLGGAAWVVGTLHNYFSYFQIVLLVKGYII